jgi:hypothetical protein
MEAGSGVVEQSPNSAAKAGRRKQVVYRSAEALRHPKSKTMSNSCAGREALLGEVTGMDLGARGPFPNLSPTFDKETASTWGEL